MPVVGPGAVQDQGVAPKSLLEKISEFEYVTVRNPLDVDFAVQVAQDIPVDIPLEIYSKTAAVQSESDVIRNYGIGIKNPEYQSRKHILNRTVIPAGQTINFRGNEALVAVRQLINEILQREGKTKLQPDPVLRAEVEGRIVVRRGLIQDLMDSSLQTTQQQALQAVEQSNQVPVTPPEETAFPTLTQSHSSLDSSMQPNETDPVKRSPGRPRKAE